MADAAGILLVAEDTGRIVVGKRASELSDGGKWSIPAGHIEQSESPSEAAEREFVEETGLNNISIENKKLLDKDCDYHGCFYTFLATTPNEPTAFNPDPKFSHEHEKLDTKGIDELLSDEYIYELHPQFLEVLQDYKDSIEDVRQEKKSMDELLKITEDYEKEKTAKSDSFEKYVDGNSVTVYHYTDGFDGDEEGLLKPNVAKQNQASFSRKDWNRSGVPRVFFYLDPDDQERQFQGKPLYSKELNANSVYDIIEDPLDLKGEIKKEESHVSNQELADLLFQKISGWTISDREWERREQIADGAFYKTRYFPVIVYFEPVRVTRVDSKEDL